MEWKALRAKAMALLQKESELQEIVQLVGPDALPEKERVVLEGAKIIREDFLQQNAYHEVDTYCSAGKQVAMLKFMLKFYDRSLDAVNEGASAREIADLEVKDDIARLKYVDEKEFDKALKEMEGKMEREISALLSEREED